MSAKSFTNFLKQSYIFHKSATTNKQLPRALHTAQQTLAARFNAFRAAFCLNLVWPSSSPSCTSIVHRQHINIIIPMSKLTKSLDSFPRRVSPAVPLFLTADAILSRTMKRESAHTPKVQSASSQYPLRPDTGASKERERKS